jgi:hypothetical protein
MVRVSRSSLAAIAFAAAAAFVSAQEPSSAPVPIGPDAFGVTAYTATNISATSFTARDNSMVYSTSGSIGRFGAVNTLSEFYSGVDIPGGAVIDYLGLNENTDTPGVITAELFRRDPFGALTPLASVSSAGLSQWAVDFHGGLGITWTGDGLETLVLKVTCLSNPNPQFFGFVELLWRRSVSPSPAAATFNDVPTSHPFFQFVEALAASGITAGCGNDNYCPDAPLTRGQMAVFLSKALGLHWGAVP